MNKIKNELITIQSSEDGIQTVSARDLYNGLEISDRFSRWFESLLKYGFEKDIDFTSVKTSTLVNNGAKRELDDYAISIDMAKQICMLQRSEKGKQYREYFLQIEKAWNSPEAIYARALQMANHTLEHYKDKVVMLENENNQLKHALEYDKVAGWKAWSLLKKQIDYKGNFQNLIKEIPLIEEVDFAKKVMGNDKYPTTLISLDGEEKIIDYKENVLDEE